MTTTQIAARLPTDLLERVDSLVGSTHVTRSDVIRRAIELYLYRLDCERDARAYERLALADTEFALADDPRGWQGTPPW